MSGESVRASLEKSAVNLEKLIDDFDELGTVLDVYRREIIKISDSASDGVLEVYGTNAFKIGAALESIRRIRGSFSNEVDAIGEEVAELREAVDR